jgi:hypothetical protein
VTISWKVENGELGTLTERIGVNIPIDASSDRGPITFSLIAGRLPRGLRLDPVVQHDSTTSTLKIIGSPAEVKTFTTSKFVIRASDGVDIEDRTFVLSVDGSDAPVWITREGFLNVGQGKAYFVLDNAFVDFQLEATDPDVVAGDVLEYYIGPMGGELPPGLSLTRDGRITGFTDPIFSIESVNKGSGAYDTASFDTTPLDKLEARPNGFDTFNYDDFTFDYNEPSNTPRRLSRSYTFVVTVSDGRNETKRLFRMWVVTEEFLKSDNSIVQVDTNVFTADSSSNRVPLWITPSDLGRHRANNYLTIYLDVYQAQGIAGSLIYFLESTNLDGSASTLPPGMAIDQITGEVAGRIPYQAAVTKNYKFTVNAVNFLTEILSSSYNLVGGWSSTITYTVNQAVVYEGFVYICIQENRNRTPAEYPDFWLSSVNTSKKTFTISLIGEIESAIEWLTDSDLGTVEPNKPSTVSVEAQSLLYGKTTSYELMSGALPPGLELSGSGIIQGKVKQFADSRGPGLTRFYEKVDSATVDSVASRLFDVTFDGASTTFDNKFKFVVRARDASRFAQSDKEFNLIVTSVTNNTYSNLYVKALQPKNKRLLWFNFITDSNIFRPEEIYRYGDPNFGIQSELKMLVFAGIESVEAVKFVQAMSRNHYRKKLRFGDVRYSKAKDAGTQETIYEVVYVEVRDEKENNQGKTISPTVDLNNKIDSPVIVSYDSIRVDSNIPFVSDRDHQRIFPNSFKNMRSRIKSLGERDRTYLPLWMRSLQDDKSYESGFVKAIPLCFVKPGSGKKIIDRINIKTSVSSRGEWNPTTTYNIDDTVAYRGAIYTANLTNTGGLSPDRASTEVWSKNFDFNQLDFEIDRYLIDVLDNEINNKYLAFPQIGEKLP